MKDKIIIAGTKEAERHFLLSALGHTATAIALAGAAALLMLLFRQVVSGGDYPLTTLRLVAITGIMLSSLFPLMGSMFIAFDAIDRWKKWFYEFRN